MHFDNVLRGKARRRKGKPIEPKDRAFSRLAACEPPEHTLKGIRTATALAAAGMPWPEIAGRMGVTIATIHYWRDDHAETWHLEYARTMEAAVLLVQSQAGTDAVLADPQEYIRTPRACRRWTKAAGRELFPAGEVPTVASFYRSYYLPVRLADNPADERAIPGDGQPVGGHHGRSAPEGYFLRNTGPVQGLPPADARADSRLADVAQHDRKHLRRICKPFWTRPGRRAIAIETQRGSFPTFHRGSNRLDRKKNSPGS